MRLTENVVVVAELQNMDDSGRLRLASDIEIVRRARKAAICDADDLRHAPVLPSPGDCVVNGHISPT